MNPTNFDWLNQLPTTNEFVDDGLLQSLGLEANDRAAAAASTAHDQNVINYLFDSTPIYNPLNPSASPSIDSSQSVSSNTGGGSSSDGGSPRSTSTTAKDNSANSVPVPLFDGSWLTQVEPAPPVTATATLNKAATSTTHNTLNEYPHFRKMRVKKKREPIFVTESPQNAYKKKVKKTTFATPTPYSIPSADSNDQQQQHDSFSPLSNGEYENVGISRPLDKQNMTSKERRQLRNKISARNFRVRRKEYITELETIVDQQEDEIDSLKQENKKLTDMNQQLIQEVMQLRLQQLTATQQQHIQSQQPHPEAYPSLMISPPNSDTNSPPSIMDTLLDFATFSNNSSNDTYLSYSLMPTLDFSAVLADKLSSPPSSQEDRQELMAVYPLLAPALASIVLRHTFHLHYVAYLSNAFPYNATTRPKNEVLDIMHVEDWISAASTPPPFVDNGDGDDDPDKTECNQLVSAHQIECTAGPSSSPSNDSSTADDFERQILQQQYPYYALMRLRGLSHDAIIQRCRTNMERRRAAERARRLKAAASCGKLQTLHAFTSVASALLRNPSRSPMIAGVIKDTKACQITPINDHKKGNLLASPFRTALRIGHGKA